MISWKVGDEHNISYLLLMHANNNANAYPKQSMHLVSSNCIWVTLLVLTIRIATVIHSATPVHKPFQTFFQRHEPDTILRDNGYLSFEGFAKYMMDKDNYAYLYEKTKHNDEVRLGQH